MICPKCGSNNIDGSTFCIKCGANLKEELADSSISVSNDQTVEEFSAGTSSVVQQVQTYEKPAEMVGNVPADSQSVEQPKFEQSVQASVNTAQPGNSVSVSFSEYIMILIAVILKPFTAFKQELSKFNEFKNSAILALIVSGTAAIISLLSSVFSAVRVTSYYSNSVSWQWDNLKRIDYLKVFGTNFCVFLGVICAISVVYYIGGLIIKKQLSFSRLFAIVAASIVPAIICASVLSPILSMLYAPLGMIVSLVGFLYSLLIAYETINQELMLDGDVKIYFNLACLSVFCMSGYYLYVKFLVGSVLGNLSSLLG